ncbi:MAG: NADH-quinone oxidoreductase subunit J [Actinobacteria bacterium]|nr:NADH-quinone oxidoreductase subunit J [Actinomycetota bacterium]
MTVEYIVFGVMFVVALGSSLAMLFAKNAVHAALFLVATQIALAIAFLLQGAFFVAAIQIILYAGAIMVLFLFVIMLLGVDRQEALVEPLPGQRPLAIGLGALLATEILWIAFRGLDLVAAGGGGGEALTGLNRDPGNVKALAGSLFGKYTFPFEATSVLLVVAIVGVMMLARRINALSSGDRVAETDAAREDLVAGRRGAA